MSLMKWNQPKSLTGRRNWIENFFSETDSFLRHLDWNIENDLPAVNVKEEEKQYLIELAAPGMKKDDFKVELDNGVLTISAKSEETKEEKDNGYVRREFSYRNFQRSFWLPETASAEGIVAAYENGLLKLTIPKLAVHTSVKSRHIPVA
jgi:HSP20 family protein